MTSPLAPLIARLDAEGLDVAFGPFALKVDRAVAHSVRTSMAGPRGEWRPGDFEAATIELSGVTLAGPLFVPPAIEQVAGSLRERATAAPAAAAVPGAPSAGGWRLDPLARAEGRIQGHIEDAHLLFDAEVAIPVKSGQVDFNDASVEHVGPDSRLGVSRMGVYVDAPNGRSYLYQFASAPLDGVEFEQRGALLGPWISERGRIRLQPFVEAMLRQPAAGPKQGLTEQARLLLGRTALSGELRLGEGVVAIPGAQAHAQGRLAQGASVRLGSGAVGAGLTVEIASLVLSDVLAATARAVFQCDALTGQLRLRVTTTADRQARFALEIDSMRVSGARCSLP